MFLLGCNRAGSSSDSTLVSFRYSSGGDMAGGGNSIALSVINEKVFLTIASTEWWYEDNTVCEYIVDDSVMEEIAAVYRKYKMYRWDNKKFTNMFINDGASYSYSFSFDDDKSVRFSSQIYPGKYKEKLNELHDIINRYLTDASPEAGLVKTEQTKEMLINKTKPDNGLVGLQVFEYSMLELKYRILNGTSDKVTVKDNIRLINNASDEVIFSSESKYDNEIYANYAEEGCISLKERLAEGTYTLFVGDCSTVFEIRKPE